jgi:hypothetical protein
LALALVLLLVLALVVASDVGSDVVSTTVSSSAPLLTLDDGVAGLRLELTPKLVSKTGVLGATHFVAPFGGKDLITVAGAGVDGEAAVAAAGVVLVALVSDLTASAVAFIESTSEFMSRISSSRTSLGKSGF